MKKLYYRKSNFDYYIYFTVIILALIGIVFIYSASNYSALRKYNDGLFYVKKQLLAFAVGLLLMSLIPFIDLSYIKKYKWLILAFAEILLSVIFVPKLGVESYGAKRWLNLGLFTIQPSEVSKFLLMFFIASYMADNDMNKIKNFIVVLSVGLLTCLLIMLEPNMSVTICVLLCVLIMLFVSGVKIKYFIFLSIPLIVGFILLIVLEPYRMKRIVAFLDPWSNPKGEGYQLIQSLYGLGSGGWFGLGLNNSRQKYLFLPFSESDFILSVIGEEVGFIGVVVLLSIYVFLIIRCVKVAKKTESRFDFFMVVGITSVIAVQTIINVAVVTGSIPPTGIPLPFISFGGSSLISFMSAVGVVINVSNKYKTL